MPHHVYTTKGVVLALHPVRESDMSASILTRDLGLVHGTARGLRTVRSKLSTTLLDLAIVKVSLVRGKHSWRITTVTLERDLARELRDQREALKALARVIALLRKFVRGEDKHPELYQSLESSMLSLAEGKSQDILSWETRAVASMLHSLGYLSHIDLSLDNKELIKAINKGLKESGLA